jgi:hypothetical protein
MAAAAVAVSTSVCTSSRRSTGCPNVRPQARPLLGRPSPRRRLQTALAATGKTPGEAEEQVPAWAKPGADEPPPWEREGGAARGQEARQVPFYAYLLASTITAIAAVRLPEPIFHFALCLSAFVAIARPRVRVLSAESLLTKTKPLRRSAPSSSTPTSGRCSGSSAPTAPCTRRSWASSSSPVSRPPYVSQIRAAHASPHCSACFVAD